MKRFIFNFIVLIILFGVGFTACAHLTPKHIGPVSNHFDGDYFHNFPIDPKGKRSVVDFLTWFFNRNIEPWENLSYVNEPIVNRSIDLKVTWINHATVFIQINNVNILTDPIWSDRASPLSWIGPQRQTPAAIDLNNLPPIDVVVISHNHYDHMDTPTLQKLQKMFQPVFIVPLTNTHYLNDVGIQQVIELDWWSSYSINNIDITATPAQHWSKRTLFDANRSLWSGFYIKGLSQSVFYAGDTAYEKHFKLIRKKLGEPSIALLTIGAYKPQWFMKRAHTSPEEAVLAHMDLKAGTSIPIHYGTFQLGDDSPKSALTDLHKAIHEHALSNDSFKVLALGQSITIGIEHHSSDKLSAIASP